MCIWLPLLLMLGAALFGWLIGKNFLRGKVEELSGKVEKNRKLYSEMRSENANTQLKFNTMNSSYNALEKERDNLNYSISHLNLQMEKEQEENNQQFGDKYSALADEFDLQKTTWISQLDDLQSQLNAKGEEHSLLLGQYNEKPREVIKEIEVIKEVEVIREVEIIKEIPVEIIKEVEVVKSVDFDMLQKMMEQMETVEISRTVKDIGTKATAFVAVASNEKDNLKKVEGIGPKIEQLLNDAGIHTFFQLSKSKTDDLKGILKNAGSRFKMHDPGTWAKQAGLAAAGKWEELKTLQDQLNGGR